jgi:hypothetical protein
MKRSSHFRTFSIFLATFALAVMAGCASVKPQGDQQAVYASGGTVASALIAANAYQSLNSCSAPAHTLPCSDDATVAKVQTAKVRLVDAWKRADALVNTPGYDEGELKRAELILQAALDFLLSVVPAN